MGAGDRLKHLHIADVFDHTANVGNRYIMNPPGVDARIHQHNEIGNGEKAPTSLRSNGIEPMALRADGDSPESVADAVLRAVGLAEPDGLTAVVVPDHLHDAIDAALVGLTVEPAVERLWRLRIVAADRAGQPDVRDEAVSALVTLCEAAGGRFEPETVRLLDDLRARTAPDGSILAPATSRSAEVV